VPRSTRRNANDEDRDVPTAPDTLAERASLPTTLCAGPRMRARREIRLAMCISAEINTPQR
jgi:hypothetical protein